MLLNTQKSNDILEALDVCIQEVSMEFATANNDQLHHPCEPHPDRAKLLKEYKILSANEIQRNYLKSMRAERIKSKIRYIIPKKMKTFLLGLKYKKVYKKQK